MSCDLVKQRLPQRRNAVELLLDSGLAVFAGFHFDGWSKRKDEVELC